MDIKKRLFCFLFVILFINLNSTLIFALGAVPAVREFNFEPNFETSIEYTIFGGDSKLELYVEGDLAKYLTLDKKTLDREGTFIASLKLPETIEKPGRHIIFIGISEKVDEELSSQIGTSVGVHPGIIIYVPYPGRYLDIAFSSSNVNTGEPVTFLLDLTSKGTETLTFTPIIEIFDSKGAKVETLTFQQREIKSQEKLGLKKVLNTTNYNPGKYKAVAIVDYGNIAKAESEFKIGTLDISILNYTQQVKIKGLQPFFIDVESTWNDNIDGVYAEVVFSNNTNKITSFKTETTALTPWENRTISGYFDTIDFQEGYYDANITLHYFGKERGSSTNKVVKVLFVKDQHILLWIIVGSLGLLIIIVITAIEIVRKIKKKK